MLIIDTLPVGKLETNCYIVRKPAHTACAVIDPGAQPEDILAFLEKKGLTAAAVLLTHGHFDHVGGVKTLGEKTGCPVWMCEEDLTLPGFLTAGPLYYTDAYADGDTVTVADIPFTVLHTPGHTSGSVCLAAENALFSGDTLFAGCCGRVDLPGSSPRAMEQSLARLAALKTDYTVYPGHGDATTLFREQESNPCLSGF